MDRDLAYSIVKNFQRLQEERVQTYKIFEEGHKIYLSTGPHYNFIQFRSLVNDVTQDFKRISEEMITIEQKLRDELSLGNLADFINNVQEDEKKKLALTARLQLAKQRLQDHPEEIECEKDVYMLTQQLHSVLDRINEHLEEIRYEAAELV